jgi:SNF2-related domain/Helicase conserved C-terminal domain
MPSSPEAIQRFLMYQPPLPPVEFRGTEPEILHEFIGDQLLTKTKPRKHQLEGLAFALWAKRALLFYEMRTGKTKLALDFITHLICNEQLKRRALIIAHAPIGVDEWENQIPYHSDLAVCTVRSGADSLGRFADAVTGAIPCDAVLVSWSTLQQMFTVRREAVSGSRKGQEKLYVARGVCRDFARYFGAVVIDEIHMAGHHETLRFGIAAELIQHCEWRLGLTGTPFGRDPLLLWAQAYLIDAGETLSHNFHFFREAFCKTKYSPWKWSKIDYVFDHRKLPLLRDKMRSMVLTCELHEVQEVNVLSGVVRLSMSREQRRAYEEVIDNLVQLRMGQTVEIDNAFVRLRQVASGFLPFVNDQGEERIIDFLDAAKFVWLEDFIGSIPRDMSCVIFHEFIHTGERICQVLKRQKLTHDWLHGGVKDRPGILSRFQTGKSQILVANAATGGMSIDLSKAEYLCFFESPASVIARKQAEARPLARGARPLIIDDLMCAPIEEKLLSFVLEGQSLRDALLRDPKALAKQLRAAV